MGIGKPDLWRVIVVPMQTDLVVWIAVLIHALVAIKNVHPKLKCYKTIIVVKCWIDHVSVIALPRAKLQSDFIISTDFMNDCGFRIWA